VKLDRGKPLTLTTDEVAGTAEKISVSYKDLPVDVEVGNRLYLADGTIALRIMAKTPTTIDTIVEVGGELRPTQGINYPDGSLNVAAVTERDLQFLEYGLKKSVDWVAVSFVRSADDIDRVKAFIADRKSSARVLAKIEKHEALDDIEAIIKAADGIMVARGDLGIEVPLELVPGIQKDLIARCNRASKPVITATQMLESMTHNARPTLSSMGPMQSCSQAKARAALIRRNPFASWPKLLARSRNTIHTRCCKRAAWRTLRRISQPRLPKRRHVHLMSWSCPTSLREPRPATRRIISPLSVPKRALLR